MNWKTLRSVAAIVLIALIASACSTRRLVTSSERVRERTGFSHLTNERDSVVEHDTLVEVTTVTIRENERGETVRVSTVTDRERVRDRALSRDSRVKIKVDTVYIERRDSTVVLNTERRAMASSWGITLKWIFVIGIALIGLMYLIYLLTIKDL